MYIKIGNWEFGESNEKEISFIVSLPRVGAPSINGLVDRLWRESHAGVYSLNAAQIPDPGRARVILTVDINADEKEISEWFTKEYPGSVPFKG